MWAQGVHAVIRAILHQSEVCVVSRVGRQSAAQETTAGGQKWQGRDGWEAGAAEGAEARLQELASSQRMTGQKLLISRLLAVGHSISCSDS